MINKKAIINVFGLVLVFESVFMLLCVIVGLIYKEPDTISLVYSFVITSLTGGLCWLFTRDTKKTKMKRESFIIVTSVWVVMSIFGSLPYMFSGAIPHFVDAFFETISGFTTTGASVLTDIEALPHCILFWRSVTHLVGGMGIIVLAVAILPYFGFGGMQLFSAESAGVVNDKLHPQIKKTAISLWCVYIVLILIETIFLMFGGMPLFDALCHSFATLASGGFSTKNDSVAGYSPYIQYVIIIFMFFSGTNFALFYFIWKNKWNKVRRNNEFRIYGIIVLISSLVVAAALYEVEGYNLEGAFRTGTFQVVSIITSTGFATADYVSWHPYITFIMFLLMFTGACVGSTSGGIKVFRHVVLIKSIRTEFKRMTHSSAIIPIKINSRSVSSDVVYKILAFLVLYMITFVIGSLIVTFTGVDIDSSMGAVATSMGGIGPGLGIVGPASNFGSIPDAAKWTLSILMLLGRLELFSVLIIFTPDFWRV